MNEEPYIPEYITVHMGAPGTEALNIAAAFPEYIKITAACVIYPKWPESAVRTILYLQISHALFRCMSGWYRRMGYDFDVTCLPAYDLAFVQGHVTFERINRIVDEIFNSCICQKDSCEPFSFHQCEGFIKPPSCWTAAALAESGMDCPEILQNTLGDDFQIVSGLPVKNAAAPFEQVLNPGDTGKSVRELQIRLNRISRQYPSVPKINPADGVFGEQTQSALSAFRKLFQLPDGDAVDPAVWHRIAFLYTSAKRLSELHSLDMAVRGLPHGYPGVLRKGDSGRGVRICRVYLTAVGLFYPTCLPLKRSDDFDDAMENAVKAFQRSSGLEPDGIIDERTWLRLERAYSGILRCCPLEGGVPPRPAQPLKQGFFGDDVQSIQQFLTLIASAFPSIPKPSVNGLYGAKMAGVISDFQQEFELPVTGVADKKTWDSICRLYSDLVTGYDKLPGQSPGFTLSQEYPPTKE